MMNETRTETETGTETEFSRSAEVFGCGRGLDLLERIAESPDGIGTAEVSTVLGGQEQQGHRRATSHDQVRGRVPWDPVRARGGADARRKGSGLDVVGGTEDRACPARAPANEKADRAALPPAPGALARRGVHRARARPPGAPSLVRPLRGPGRDRRGPGPSSTTSTTRSSRGLVRRTCARCTSTGLSLETERSRSRSLRGTSSTGSGSAVATTTAPCGRSRRIGRTRGTTSAWYSQRRAWRNAGSRSGTRSSRTIQAVIDENREGDGLWKVLDGSKVYRYVDWMGTREKPYAPPVDLRLRVQCEAVVEPEVTRQGQRQAERPRPRILRFESLRGEEWTGARAECRRQGFDVEGQHRLVEVRYAKQQRNPFERAAARALRRRGTGGRARRHAAAAAP